MLLDARFEHLLGDAAEEHVCDGTNEEGSALRNDPEYNLVY